MSKIYDGEISKMQHLISYGLNENASKDNAPVVEYHAEGADGKTYGILRECNKFYIKVAPKKDTPILAEDYDYIGGYMNKKDNEYTTYSVASKQFDLKMKQLSESVGSKKAIEQFSKVTPSEWQTNETKEMREEINRFVQIVNNSAKLDEGKGAFVGFPTEHVLPEAPAENPSKEKVNSPYTAGAPKGEPKMKNGKTSYEKTAPFVEEAEAKMDSDKTPKGNGDTTYSENVNEGRTVKLTEEQVLAWNRNKDYMDKGGETSVGSSSPFAEEVGCESNQCEADTDPIREGAVTHNSNNQNIPSPGTSERGDDDPFTENAVNESDEVDPEDVAGMSDDEFEVELDDDGLYNDDEGFEDDDEDVPFPEVYGGKDQMRGLEDWEKTWDKFDDDDEYIDDGYVFDSRRRPGEKIYEVVLDDFGKHPAYRKRPMTTPTHKISDVHGKDWNDDSAKTDEPFGKKIGDGDPFTEKVSQMIVDSIVDRMLGKKKD